MLKCIITLYEESQKAIADSPPEKRITWSYIKTTLAHILEKVKGTKFVVRLNTHQPLSRVLSFSKFVFWLFLIECSTMHCSTACFQCAFVSYVTPPYFYIFTYSSFFPFFPFLGCRIPRPQRQKSRRTTTSSWEKSKKLSLLSSTFNLVIGQINGNTYEDGQIARKIDE